MANELCDFFIKIDPSMERSLVFKRKIDHATAEYQSQLKDLLKAAKQEKITKFFKPLPKHDNSSVNFVKKLRSTVLFFHNKFFIS